MAVVVGDVFVVAADIRRSSRWLPECDRSFCSTNKRRTAMVSVHNTATTLGAFFMAHDLIAPDEPETGHHLLTLCPGEVEIPCPGKFCHSLPRQSGCWHGCQLATVLPVWIHSEALYSEAHLSHNLNFHTCSSSACRKNLRHHRSLISCCSRPKS